MKHFDIDSFTPNYDPPFKLWRRATGADKINYMKACRVHTTSGRGDRGAPGVDPAKVLDWRRLETRTHELWKKWERANAEFWDACRKARADRRLGKNQELLVFTHPDWLLRCTPDGISHEDPEYTLKDQLSGKNSHREFALMKWDEGGREIGLLEARANVYQRCAGVYERVLERALRDRIGLYIDQLREEGHTRSYYPPKIYIIENEGRARVAHSDSIGKITWMTGDVMCTRA